MQRPLMLIAPLLAILVAPLVSGSQPRPQQVLFQKLLHLDDVVLKPGDQPLLQSRATSKIDCSRRCAGTEGCAMSTFQPGQEHASPGGSCQLYSQLPNATVAQEASPGARSYRKQDNAVPADNAEPADNTVPADNAEPLQCAAPYTIRCGRCLLFVTSLQNFTSARKICHDVGSGSLMVLRSREELDCVMLIMHGYGSSEMWVGADDMTQEGRYVWEDGTALPFTSSLWASGDPRSLLGKGCILIYYFSEGLKKEDCSVDQHAVCEG